MNTKCWSLRVGRITQAIIGLLSSALLLSALASCVRSTQDDIFDNYLYRLHNSLQTPDIDKALLTDKPLSLPRYPPKRVLKQPVETLNIHLLDFLRLSSCELQRHLGQRNSSLGIFMLPSQQLLYEYQFLKLAHQCLQQLPLEEPLYVMLSEAVDSKQHNLPYVRANAVFTSDELITLFSLGGSSLNVEQMAVFPQALLSALEQLEQFVVQPAYNSQKVEQAYAIIGSSKYIGQLRLSMQQVIQYLALADQQLRYRIEHKPLCINGQPNRQFEVLYTVFHKFYIAEIQPYMALLHQQVKAVLQQTDNVVKAIPSPAEFSQFWHQVYRGETSEWHRYDRAIGQHTRLWQQLLEQCGRPPSSVSSNERQG